MTYHTDEWTPDVLRDVNSHLEGRSPREILEWSFETFAEDITLATGFGPSGVVLMHLVSQLRPETTVFYLDTGLLFPETYALRDRLERELGIVITPVHPAQTVKEQEDVHGPRLWEREPDRCCHLRKVEPLRRYLAGKRAWISGIRRDQSRSRAHVDPVGWDQVNGLIKLSPLVHWTSEDVWGYIRLLDLPYNELHDRSYPSIGCLPCTRPVSAGQDPRSGRWSGHNKTECGIHVQSSVYQ